MATELKLRRGTTSQHSTFTGADAEVTVDTDKETVVVHDGSTAGGYPVAREDLSNVSISAGDLPSEAYQKNNILGTVSESSGVPTGAIIERGSNSNGEFVKYADGTLIMKNTFPATFDRSTRFRDNVTFPVTHTSGTGNSSELSIIGGNVIGMSGGIIEKMLSPRFFFIETTSVTMDVPVVEGQSISSNDGYTATYIAIGRWY